MEKLGEIKVSDGVIGTIAATAAINVEGVVGMSAGIVDGVVKLLTGTQLTKGMRVEMGEEEVAIDISVIVKYGAKISDVAFNVQKEVKSAVEQMTSLSVVEVNVFIEGVELTK
ncbi:Asp23/Gls24 family envelope stress response protein [bacterium]|nr:Asp23/Gls24 family envelope stress response protein [bacterium]